MKFIKKHFFAILAVILLLIILGGSAFAVYLIFYSESTDPYNTRLTDISKHPIDTKEVNEAKEKLIESGKVSSVNFVLEGKLMNFDINFVRDTSLDAAKEIASKVLESFTDDELKYYDVHIILNNTEELEEVALKNKDLAEDSEERVKAVFPVFGSKHKTVEGRSIHWTK